MSDRDPMAEREIGALARDAGLTTRALRHFDAIGLVPPSRTDSSGRRWYDRDAQLRLKQALVLRELRLSLSAIRDLLDGRSNITQTLNKHAELLREESSRLTALAGTVENTLRLMGDDKKMINAIDPFAGIFGYDTQTQQKYEQEITEKYGADKVIDSLTNVAKMSSIEAEAIVQEFAQVESELSALMVNGVPVEDPKVQGCIRHHFEIICKFWTPNQQAYLGLGLMYLNDPRFLERKERVAVGLAAYESAAMTYFAETNLD